MSGSWSAGSDAPTLMFVTLHVSWPRTAEMSLAIALTLGSKRAFFLFSLTDVVFHFGDVIFIRIFRFDRIGTECESISQVFLAQRWYEDACNSFVLWVSGLLTMGLVGRLE